MSPSWFCPTFALDDIRVSWVAEASSDLNHRARGLRNWIDTSNGQHSAPVRCLEVNVDLAQIFCYIFGSANDGLDVSCAEVQSRLTLAA